MSTARTSALLVALIAVLALVPATASGQEPPFRVSFAPSVAALGGDAELALSGTAAYRFSEHFWFEGDVTWLDAAAGGLRNLDPELPAPYLADLGGILRRGGMFDGNVIGLPDIPIGLPILPILPFPRFSATVDGSTFIATLGVRYELPRQTSRFRPYLSGGLGINNTDQDVRIEPLGIDRSTSSTGYAVSGGAGASVRVWGQLWADVDAKYFRLSDDRDIMRFGGGVSFRF